MLGMDQPTNHDAATDDEIIRPEVVIVLPPEPWPPQPAPVAQPRQRSWRVPAALFVATCFSTVLAGIFMAAPMDLGWHTLHLALPSGLRYAFPVMTILLCHEMGHFLQAYRYGVYASLPYFIPFLPPFGTFGAVIAMEPRVGGRRALFDIGISGPLAGLVPTIVFLVYGLYHFKPSPPHNGLFAFGDPLLFQFLASHIIPRGYDVTRDPMVFAGWVGLFITSLNLMPIGQLDGGHVLYALLRQKADKVASLLLFSAVMLVVWKWDTLKTWTLMLFLLLLMGPSHPPTANDDEPLGVGRTILGWLTLAFILIGFTPVPFRQ